MPRSYSRHFSGGILNSRWTKSTGRSRITREPILTALYYMPAKRSDVTCVAEFTLAPLCPRRADLLFRSPAEPPIRPRCLLLRCAPCHPSPAPNLRHPEFAAVNATQQSWDIEVGIKVRPVQSCSASNNLHVCKLLLRSRLQPLQVLAWQHAAPAVGQFQDEEIETRPGQVLNPCHKRLVAQASSARDGAIDLSVGGHDLRSLNPVPVKSAFHGWPPIMQQALQSAPPQPSEFSLRPTASHLPAG